jgi:hypothetical protein
MTGKEYTAMMRGRRSLRKGTEVRYKGRLYRLASDLAKADGNAVLRQEGRFNWWLHVSPRDLEPTK